MSITLPPSPALPPALPKCPTSIQSLDEITGSGLRKRKLERKRAALERQVSAPRAGYEAKSLELRRFDEQVGTRTRVRSAERSESAHLRQADARIAVSARGKPSSERRLS